MSNTEIEEKDNYYISPKEFGEDVKKYYDLSLEAERGAKAVEDYAGDRDGDEYGEMLRAQRVLLRKQKRQLDRCGVYLWKMIMGLSNNGRFSNYTWRDEMVADAMIQCNRALVGRKYDFSRGVNIFSYFNRVAWREFIHRIKVEKKKVEVHQKYIEEHAKDFAEEADENVYVKPSFVSKLGEFWDVEQELTYNDRDKR